MKKLLITVAIVLSMMATQQSAAKVQNVNGKLVYVEDTTQVSKDEYLCEYPLCNKRTKEVTYYPCYRTKNGAIYIIRVSSKTGKEYRQYLKKDEKEELLNELNIK